MTSSLFALYTKQFMLAAAAGFAGGLIMTNTPLRAQPVESQPMEEITVVAPYEVQRTEVGRSPTTGGKIELISLTRHVSYADLDLTKQSDVNELEARIKKMAKDSCKRLDEMYPPSMYPPATSGQDCVKMAVADSKTQIDRAVSSAHHR